MTIFCFPSKHPFSTYNIPTNVTSIGNSAFSDCSKLESIKMPTGVTSISDSMFSNYRNLQSITIPQSVTSIGDSAFSDCSDLQSIIVESKNLHFVSKEGIRFTKDFATIIHFPSKHPFSTYNIPTYVTLMGKSAFLNCFDLQSITIPTSVTSIGDSAFSHCYNLQSVTIPTSVISTGTIAFSHCSNLQTVTILASVTSIAKYMFFGVLIYDHSQFQQVLHQLVILRFLSVKIYN